MPHVIKLKDGKLLVPLGAQDALDAVEKYVGDELRHYLEENLTDTAALEQELDKVYVVLCDIQEEADVLDELLDAPRLDRKKLKKAASSIWLMCNREL